MRFPLSLTLPPFVPHEGRGFALCRSIWAVIYSGPKRPIKSPSREILTCAREVLGGSFLELDFARAAWHDFGVVKERRPKPGDLPPNNPLRAFRPEKHQDGEVSP
jgi:hypothetical protein